MILLGSDPNTKLAEHPEQTLGLRRKSPIAKKSQLVKIKSLVSLRSTAGANSTQFSAK
jgi:hypothetical protein